MQIYLQFSDTHFVLIYGAEVTGLWMDERIKSGVMETKCSRRLCGVNRKYMCSREIRRRVGVSESLSDRVDRKALKWLRHV